MRTLSCLFLVLAACGDDGGSGAVDAAVDATGDAPPTDGGLATTCTGACAETDVAITYDGNQGTLDVAYFGVNLDQTLRVEAYAGAAPGCPEMNSPTPDVTLILVAVPRPTSTAPSSTTATLLDFAGELLPSPAPARAATVTLTPVAFSDQLIALDAAIAFADPANTATGHIFATHCDSLDEAP